ncbi:hypothetical protein K439DRAFT_1625167 [Ramaria rubella]|nr:hypothetical protein K439DRAFT_1625167 [Ramaria rubella]
MEGGPAGGGWAWCAQRGLRGQLGCVEGVKGGGGTQKERRRPGGQRECAVGPGVHGGGWVDSRDGQMAQRGPRGQRQYPEGEKGAKRAAGVCGEGQEGAEGWWGCAEGAEGDGRVAGVHGGA